MPDTAYNGWTNYETWLVNLHIGNDQGMSEYAANLAQCAWDDTSAPPFWTGEDAARFELAGNLKEWVENDLVPDLGGIAGDLINDALGEVNWREIAINLLVDINRRGVE